VERVHPPKAILVRVRSTTLRVVAALAALGSFAAYLLTSHVAFLFLSIPALLLLATSLGLAAGLAASLQRSCGKPVDVRVWGASLPSPDGAVLTMTSAMALGAGLHVFLRTGPGGPSLHLKIAQPERARIEPGAVLIETAAYVQWAGRRLPRVAGVPAVTITPR
jgi:uncharacterized protein (DUF58 family)